MKTLNLLFLFLLVTTFAWTQPLEKQKDCKAKAEKVAELFAFNKYGPAIDAMAPFWSIPEKQREEFKVKTIDKMVSVEETYGSPIGHTFVKDQEVTDYAYRVVYFVRYKYSAMRLEFIFYKNNSGWTLNSFSWDMDFEKEFE